MHPTTGRERTPIPGSSRGEGTAVPRCPVLAGHSVSGPRYGDGMPYGDTAAPIQHRILARVEAHPGGCWIWVAARDNGSGYGRLTHNGRLQLAHRLAYEAWVGPIPAGLEIDHLCRVKGCVKPSHLEPVTHAENTRRHFEWYRSQPKPFPLPEVVRLEGEIWHGGQEAWLLGAGENRQPFSE